MSRVLIIDDGYALLAPTRSILGCAGYEVLEARDGLAGLQRAVEDAPDLILVEADLFGLDGFEVCSRLAAEGETSSIPVLLCSVKWDPGRLERARQSGAFDRLVLPMSAGRLGGRIEDALKKRGSREGVAASSPVPPAVIDEALLR
jgi:PleD family two-component response regulator